MKTMSGEIKKSEVKKRVKTHGRTKVHNRIKTLKWVFKDIQELEGLSSDDLNKQIKKINDLKTECSFKLDSKYINAFINDQQRLLEGEVDTIGRVIEKTIISANKIKTKTVNNIKEERYIDRFLWEELLQGEDVLQSIQTPEELETWKEICIARLNFCIQHPEYRRKLLKIIWWK